MTSPIPSISQRIVRTSINAKRDYEPNQTSRLEFSNLYANLQHKKFSRSLVTTAFLLRACIYTSVYISSLLSYPVDRTITVFCLFIPSSLSWLIRVGIILHYCNFLYLFTLYCISFCIFHLTDNFMFCHQTALFLSNILMLFVYYLCVWYVVYVASVIYLRLFTQHVNKLY